MVGAAARVQDKAGHYPTRPAAGLIAFTCGFVNLHKILMNAY